MTLTVDDLPTHGPVTAATRRLDVALRMLATFRRHAVPEVYGFVNAGQLDGAPEHRSVIDRWLEAGFPIGNHTYSHPNIDAVDLDTYLTDIQRNDDFLERIAPGVDYKVFRFPYLCEGKTAEKRRGVRDALKRTGYRIAEVTIDFNDWAWNEAYHRCAEKNDRRSIEWLRRAYYDFARERLDWSRRASSVLFGRPIKHILLLHIAEMESEMLDGLLTVLEQDGARYVRLREALSDDAYAYVPESSSSNDVTFLERVAQDRGMLSIPVPGRPNDALDRLCR